MMLRLWLSSWTLALVCGIAIGLPVLPTLLAGFVGLGIMVAPSVRERFLVQRRAVEVFRQNRKHVIASYRRALKDATSAGDTERAARLRDKLLEYEFWG
jgi:hypothetical protein